MYKGAHIHAHVRVHTCMFVLHVYICIYIYMYIHTTSILYIGCKDLFHKIASTTPRQPSLSNFGLGSFSSALGQVVYWGLPARSGFHMSRADDTVDKKNPP